MNIKKIAQLVLATVVFVGCIILALWLSVQVSQNDELRETILNFGYLGVFFISLVSGFNVIVPLPVISFLPALTEAGLEFWTTICVITIGMTVGDSIGFFIGYISRAYTDIENKRIFAYLARLQEKHFWLPIAFMVLYSTFAPLPNELVVIPLAILGYKYRYVVGAVLVGNFIFNTMVAHGITNLFKFLI